MFFNFYSLCFDLLVYAIFSWSFLQEDESFPDRDQVLIRQFKMFSIVFGVLFLFVVLFPYFINLFKISLCRI